MPGAPLPVGQNGNLPPFWNSVLQALQQQIKTTQGITGGLSQGIVLDMWGNAVKIEGTNLNQVVTIGASHGQAGVQVGTALGTPSAPVAGLAWPQGVVTTTIHTTAGSTSATVASASGLSTGDVMVIGAANVTDPSSGVATPAIVPGTTIHVLSGTSVTLSQNAAESGTGLFCAACFWRTLNGLTYP